MQETQVQSLGREDPLEEEMATHFSILAWKIPWTEEPSGQQSMVSKSWTRLSNTAPDPVLGKQKSIWYPLCWSIYPRGKEANKRVQLLVVIHDKKQNYSGF